METITAEDRDFLATIHVTYDEPAPVPPQSGPGLDWIIVTPESRPDPDGVAWGVFTVCVVLAWTAIVLICR